MDDRAKTYEWPPARGDLITTNIGFAPSEDPLDPPEIVYLCEEQAPRAPTGIWGLIYREEPSAFAKAVFIALFVVFVWLVVTGVNMHIADFFAAIAPQAVPFR